MNHIQHEGALKKWIDAGKRRVANWKNLPPALSPAQHRQALRELHLLVALCPFCGKRPVIGPEAPWDDGNAWGFVKCENGRCAVRPAVADDSRQADERGSVAYIALAIRRWNRRA